MFSIVGFMVLLAAITGSGVVAGLLVWMVSRIRRLESGGMAGGDPALRERLETLLGEMEAVRDTVARLEEQASFTEQLLLGRPGPQDAPGAAKPGGERGEGGGPP